MKKKSFFYIMLSISLLVSVFALPFNSSSFPIDGTNVIYAAKTDSKKAKKIYDRAVKEFNDGQLKNAVSDWKKSAKLGSMMAESQVASQYLNGMGVKQNYHQALVWGKKAYKHGEHSGMAANTVGTVYLNGDSKVKKNYKLAMKYFKIGDKEGYMKSSRQIATMYQHGQGVKIDLSKTAKWYTKAADEGDITSQYNLGKMYEQGQGVNQDYAKAMILYKKAASNSEDVSAPGVIESMEAIAKLYDKGLGVTQDYHQAELWYQKAFNASQKQVKLLQNN